MKRIIQLTLILMVFIGSSISHAQTSFRYTYDYSGNRTNRIEIDQINWTGTLSTDWYNPANWSTNTIPNTGSKVIISPRVNNPVIGYSNSINAICKDLTIESGAVLTINPLGSLNVTGTLTNFSGVSGLIIKSDNTGTGSLKQLSGNVLATFEQFLSGNVWHNVSAPVTQSITSFLTNPGNDVVPTLENYRGMIDFITDQNKWNSYFTNTHPGNTDTGKGFMLRTSTDAPVTYTGILNSGEVFIDLLKTGYSWNCIGNPYSTALDLQSFMLTNYSQFNPNFLFIYVWEDMNNSAQYKVYNSFVDSYEPKAGEGFFVKAAIGNSTPLIFNPSMQKLKNNVMQLQATFYDFPEIEINLNKAGSILNTAIKFIENTTTDMDIGYDAIILKADQSFSVYSFLLSDSETQLILQSLPTNQYSNLIIPIGFDCVQGGELTLSATTANLPPECKVILEDTFNGSFTDLEQSDYTTVVDANTLASKQFRIHTSYNTVPFIWTGSTSTDWNTPGNWAQGTVPLVTDNILVQGALINYPMIDEAVIMNNLEIKPGATVTIASNGSVTVTGTLSNNAGNEGLVIQSNMQRETGSLMHSTANVPATAQRLFPSIKNKWLMVSSPVTTYEMNTENIDNLVYQGHLFTWHEGAQSWKKLGLNQGYPTWLEANGSNSFLPARGYLISYDVDNPSRTFTGNLNQGEVEIPLSFISKSKDLYQGYNFVGNPYPSAIDWKASQGWTRTHLKEIGSDGYAYWIWNNDAGNYGTFQSNLPDGAGTLGTGRYISPNQAFWVLAKSGGNLGMDNSIRVHSNQVFLKNGTVGMDELRLTVKSHANSFRDEIIISLNQPNGSDGVRKLFSLYKDAPSLYSVKSDLNYSILGFDKIPEKPITIGFKAGFTGEFFIEAQGELLNKNLVLEDVINGSMTRLSEGEPVRFKASAADQSNRFLLHFGSTTGLMPESNIEMGAWFSNGLLSIVNPFVGETKAELFDTSGRLIAFWNLQGRGTNQKELQLNQTGVFMLRLSNNSQIKTIKLIINE